MVAVNLLPPCSARLGCLNIFLIAFCILLLQNNIHKINIQSIYIIKTISYGIFKNNKMLTNLTVDMLELFSMLRLSLKLSAPLHYFNIVFREKSTNIFIYIGLFFLCAKYFTSQYLLRAVPGEFHYCFPLLYLQ